MFGQKKLSGIGRIGKRNVEGSPSLDWFDQLEQRVLLSGDSLSLHGPFAGEFAMTQWNGSVLEVVRDSWIVSFSGMQDSKVAEARALALASELGVDVASVMSIARGRHAELKIGAGMVTESQVRKLVDKYEDLLGITPNRGYHPNAVPNDPLFTQQYGLENNGQFIEGQFGFPGADINVVEAWDITTGSRDVVIAVIDTGVDLTHPDLAPNIWVNPFEIAGNGQDDDGNGFIDDINGWDFGENNNNPQDNQGHGTAVAGVIGAVGNNGIGVAGVAWNVSILPLKISTASGGLTEAAILGAHDYATSLRERGINVAASNNSYGGFFAQELFNDGEGFDPERAAIERFINSGGVFVAAAGNDGLDTDQIRVFPAGYEVPGIINVAATNNQDQLAGFSNFGALSVDLAAPGASIFTTSLGGGYQFIDGTSFAAPMVAGAVALLASLRPNASGEELRQVLIESAQPLPSLQGVTVSGGRLDVLAAILTLTSEGPKLDRAEPGPVAGQFVGANALSTLRFTFDEDIDPQFINASGVSVVRAGPDQMLGTSDDVTIPISSVTLDPDGRTLIVNLNLTGLSPQRLPIDSYRVVIDDAIIRDFAGNLLNGNADGGIDEVYNFRIVGPSSSLEPNDTVFDAVPIVFTASGVAQYTGLVLGDGLNAQRDVDFFRVSMPRAGLLRAEVIAQNRPGGSDFDGVLRLFNASGQEIAVNDQFNGSDPLIDFFVPSAGLYFVGVSGFPNFNYNLIEEASGPEGQSTGVYDLRISADLVQRERVNVNVDYSDAPLRIPVQGTQGTFSDTIVVTDSRAITDVNVRFNIEHTFTGDLEISLIAPNGQLVQLVNRRGGNGDNFTNTLIDDEASLTIAQGSAPFNAAGGYRPEQPLNQLDGISAAGQWTLLVQDRAALNIGQLISWGLELEFSSDINGPFESNDTLATARTLETLRSTGISTIQAALGDGGFGSLDRDIFVFEGVQGETLSINAISTSTANLAVRVFNAAGQEILISNPQFSSNASIDRFVLPTTSVYYIAVSEASNIAYDPNDAASGVPAITSGSFTLQVRLGSGISDTQRVLEGSRVSFATGPTGTFFTSAGGQRTGLTLDGNEFLVNRNQAGDNGLHFFGASASGFTFRNDGPAGDTDLPLALTDQSDSFNRRMVGVGELRGLEFERSLAYGIGDSFIAIDVLLTNTTATTITGVTWMEGLDPQPGLNQIVSPTKATANDIRNDPFNAGNFPLAVASATSAELPNGLAIALAAPASDGSNVGGRATATFYDPATLLVRDPTQLIAAGEFDPNGAIADLTMALTFDIGSIAAGQQVSIRYFVLMGTESDIQTMYAQINTGTGTGHLAANRSNPAAETLQTAPGDPRTTAPTLPYRLFYPEGFAGPETFTFVPIINPNDTAVRVVVLARYESGDRDQVLRELFIPAGARGGIQITSPELFASDQQLVRKNTPYAVEIRSDLPVGANFSHFDLFLFAGDEQSSLGESFVSQTDTTFVFADVVKGPGVRDFLLVQNTQNVFTKYDLTFINEAGQTFTLTRNLAEFRRSGIDVNNNPFFTNTQTGQIGPLPDGRYGVIVEADTPVVAAISHYDANLGTSSGVSGTPGIGATAGVLLDGQFGVNGDGRETIGILNAGETNATVLLKYQFQSGTTFRTTVNVPAQTRVTVTTNDFAAFPVGEPYAIEYEATVPVSMQINTQIFGDEYASVSADRAYTLWTFGEGFRPPVNRPAPANEYLRLYNPQDSSTVVEIRIRFTDGVEQSFFRTLEPRRVVEFDVYNEFIVNRPPNQNQFFGITVKAANPIVAYLGHFDGFFPGGFGTLGTPFGTPQAISALNPGI